MKEESQKIDWSAFLFSLLFVAGMVGFSAWYVLNERQNLMEMDKQGLLFQEQVVRYEQVPITDRETVTETTWDVFPGGVLLPGDEKRHYLRTPHGRIEVSAETYRLVRTSMPVCVAVSYTGAQVIGQELTDQEKCQETAPE